MGVGRQERKTARGKKNKKRKDCMRNEELYGWEQPPKCDDVTRATTVQKETIFGNESLFLWGSLCETRFAC